MPVRLGDFLVDKKLTTPDKIEEALRKQVGGGRKLGYILVKMNVISADKMAEALSEHLGVPIVDINEKFSPEVKKVLPRYLCKKYGVLPLSFQKNNTLELAMSDPMDEDTIMDIEHYTRMAVQPHLARHSDIEKSRSNITFSIKDLFNSETKILSTGVVGLIALLLLIPLGVFTFNYVQKERYGTVSQTATHTLYKHHDLILGVDQVGKVSLLGHGAFSDGYYSVAFENSSFLKSFLQTKEKDFSEKQMTWLDWAISKVDSNSSVAMK